MTNRFDIPKAPLRAEPRPYAATPNVQSVPATPGGLIRSTLLAAAAAGAILVLFWLPAEYGIDPTGVGALTGLTEMGEIKQQLSAEAEGIRPVRAAGGSAVTVALHGDHLAKVFNAEWGEGQDFDFFGAIDPDHPVFGFHADGEIMKVIDSFAEVRSDAVDGLDGMDLVQLHGQAASAMC